MREEANVRLIQELYDAFSRGDIGAVLSFVDPRADFIFEAPKTIPWSGNWQGLEGWSKFFGTLAESADEITLQMEPIAAQSDRVVAAGRYQATVKLTGRRIESRRRLGRIDPR